MFFPFSVLWTVAELKALQTICVFLILDFVSVKIKIAQNWCYLRGKKNGRLFMSSWECLYKQSSKIRMENASSQVKIFSYIVLDRLLALISAVFPASNKCSHKQVVFWNPVLGLALRHRRFHISLLASKTLNSVT